MKILNRLKNQKSEYEVKKLQRDWMAKEQLRN